MATTISFKNKLKRYFSQPPCLHVVLYFSSGYLGGLDFSAKDRKIKNYFISPLQKDVIRASFSQKNIKDEMWLKEKLRQELAKLHLSERKVACLIPELSLKAFIFLFDTFPLNQEEREELLRFRIRKQLAAIPEDIRFSYDVIRSNNSQKVVVATARSSVVREYEDLLARLGLKVKVVNSPLFALFNLTQKEKDTHYLIANIENDSLGLMAVTSTKISLYRQKPFDSALSSGLNAEIKIEDIVKEIENTANFIEDKENKKINFVLLRFGFVDRKEEFLASLQNKLSMSIKIADVSFLRNISQDDRHFLSPLIGQVQC
ncbi:MAG: hypothetical protein ACE5GI_02190 [Candidatus Aminicenantales bacterium]